MTGLRGWGLSEQHLALDALVAFVDGELSPSAHDRAAAHLATCPSCATEADAQRQARSAVRTAETPSISPQLLRTLQSIPTTAELPEQPDNLALSEDGQLVTLNRRTGDSKSAPLGTSTPLGKGSGRFGSVPEGGSVPLGSGTQHSKTGGRRAKQSAGVVFSGLVLGALAFMNTPMDGVRDPSPAVPDPAPQEGAVEDAASSAGSNAGVSETAAAVPTAGPTTETPTTSVSSSPKAPVRTSAPVPGPAS
ncbi:Putative zinc-finger [Actinopolyspora xinjiangensis]|uniref:Putative zinc-finger n=1 Tax=Actinopolyspora xinjiangensis TaxID=405564 RepID=A0A1H0QYN8_9ACTN|nr:zf-HC2 domain-containing protein [Actinopolyspora xinjiangensis]SDP21876.1 Putative zinc-finger [Actinopolyspora xinjiangensis]